MKCYKCDNRGEVDCIFAKKDLGAWEMQCTHPCVIMADSAKRKADEARCSAEATLAKYREAIQPFVDNCRAVIAAVDGEKEGATK